MIKKLKHQISTHLTNIPGWHTNRKIVVIESDDWGSIRMPSLKILKRIKALGIQVEKCHYVSNDSLASEEDLDKLFCTLKSIKGLHNQHPVFTANVILCNPDFQKIKESNFEKYHHELFTDTFKKYPKHSDSFKIWKEGMQAHVFHPQFHGREHLHVNRWLNCLKNKESETRKVFELGVFGLSKSVTTEKRDSYMAAYDWEDQEDRRFILESVDDGLNKFKSMFGYNSESSMAPNYIWHKDIEKVYMTNGVQFIQGGKVQRSPNLNKVSRTKIRHYTGQKNQFSQRYLVRNCQFEPSSNPSNDWVDKCLKQIETAFYWRKPAIIETHRVNYIGYINPSNRDDNLMELQLLLNKIVKNWPEVEFLTSDQLGKIIKNE